MGRGLRGAEVVNPISNTISAPFHDCLTLLTATVKYPGEMCIDRIGALLDLELNAGC